MNETLRMIRGSRMYRTLLGLMCLLWVLPVSAQERTSEALLEQMTLEQRVAQMFMISFYGHPLNEPARDLIAEWQPGAVVLLPSNLGTPVEIARLTNDIQQTALDAGGVPLWIAVDQEGGIIAHLEEGFTRFPVPMLLTAAGDPELARRFGRALALEMRSVGFNMNLAPVADLYTNPANPIIGRRSYGADAEMVAQVLPGVIEGMQTAGVLATVKHFPGHGDTAADSHVTLPVIEHDRARLETVELVPFRAAIAADVGAVMVAHVAFPALDSVEKRPASLSPDIVTGLLREKLAYPGMIMTDALDMDAIDQTYSVEEAVLAAVQAGHDLILTGAHVGPAAQARAMQAVVDAVREGTIPEERINASVRRILQMKLRYGVLNWQPRPPDVAARELNAIVEENIEFVEEMFRSGITIVYDREGLIPVGGDTAFIYPASRPSLWATCRPYASGVRVVGVSDSPVAQEIEWAVQAAASSERVVVFTQNLEINAAQRTLIEALPLSKTVVVALWSPDDLLYIPPPAAYVVTYSPLFAAHDPICSVLFGSQPARGRPAVGLVPPTPES